MDDAGACRNNAVMEHHPDRNHAVSGEMSPVRYELVDEKKVSCLTWSVQSSEVVA
jgi:hypothetical protein